MKCVYFVPSQWFYSSYSSFYSSAALSPRLLPFFCACLLFSSHHEYLIFNSVNPRDGWMDGRTGSFWLDAPPASVTTPRTAFTRFPRDLLRRLRRRASSLCMASPRRLSITLLPPLLPLFPGDVPPMFRCNMRPPSRSLPLSDDHLRVQPSASSLRDGIWLVTAYLYYCTLTKCASRCVLRARVRVRAAVFHLINSPCWHMGQIDQLGCQLSWQISPSVSLFLGPTPPTPTVKKTHFSHYFPLLALASSPTRWHCTG